MPELPPFNPSVSVFHLSSKVSNAKIRKYKLATERGMVNASTMARPEDVSSTIDATAPRHGRLKLNVRAPVDIDDGDVINVVRTQRTQTKTKRDWTEAFGKSKQTRTRNTQSKESSSSGLSSADLGTPTSKEGDDTTETTASPRAARRSAQRESYGDLMSYYIEDDDEPQEEASKASTNDIRAATRQQKPHKTINPSVHPRDRVVHTGSQAPSSLRQQEAIGHAHRKTHPGQPQHQSSVPLAAFEQFNLGPPDPVPVMIQKLEALSQALTEFGGVPPNPPSPSIPGSSLPYAHPHTGRSTNVERLAVKHITAVGQHDEALTYGIQFIINALKSWAQQRLAQLHMQAMAQTYSGQLQQPITFTLAGTPEGRAIAAFRAVVESGCLRVKTVIPVELSRALRRLYLQIDHLINQGGKQDLPWRCLSYRAQIEANRLRVNHWRDEQAKVEQEMIRHHQYAHQHMMQQMGLPAHFTSTMFYQQPHDVEDLAHHQQRQKQNLIRLPAQATDNPMAGQRLPVLAKSYKVHNQALDSITGSQRRKSSSKHETKRPNALLPRSGQSMQFSFAATSDAALQGFEAKTLHTGRQVNTQGQHSKQVTTSISVAANAKATNMNDLTGSVLKHNGFTVINVDQSC